MTWLMDQFNLDSHFWALDEHSSFRDAITVQRTLKDWMMTGGCRVNGIAENAVSNLAPKLIAMLFSRCRWSSHVPSAKLFGVVFGTFHTGGGLGDSASDIDTCQIVLALISRQL